MKKLTICAIAIAALAMTMTSCKKNEATIPDSINVTVEENEILNDMKTHLVGTQLFWDEGDQIYLLDNSKNGAHYAVRNGNSTYATFDFVRAVYGTFDPNNGPIVAYYPTSIGIKRNIRQVELPAVQYSDNGNLEEFPMYAEGTIGNFSFKNLCGVIRLRVTADVAIDSISITTDKAVSGVFRINMSDPTNPVLTPDNSGAGHGVKTKTMKLRNAETPSNKTYNIYLPVADYNTFVVTFYSGNTQYVRRANTTVSVTRTNYTIVPMNLTGAEFTNIPMGTVNGVFSVSANQTVRFAKGNLQYIAANRMFWHLADNQWDCLAVNNGGNDYDRDAIAWGANRYNDQSVRGANINGNVGNAYTIWPISRNYTYLPGTEVLAGVNEWGNNRIANGGNATNLWRTLTWEEWSYLLNSRAGQLFLNAELNLGGETVKGLIIFPDNYTATTYANANVADAAATTIEKREWNALEAAGCVFLPAKSYRKASGNYNARPTTEGMSYYWTATPNTDTQAKALAVSENNIEFVEMGKAAGAYIRLVQNI